AHEVLHQVVAVAAAAAIQVELQGNGGGERAQHRLQSLRRQGRASQVGVQHGAGEVEHAAQARARAFLQRLADVRGQRRWCQRVALQAVFKRGLAQGTQLRAQGGGEASLAESVEQWRELGLAQQAIKRRNIAGRRAAGRIRTACHHYSSRACHSSGLLLVRV